MRKRFLFAILSAAILLPATCLAAAERRAVEQEPAAAVKVRVAGTVRTAEKIPVPGATLRITHVPSGQGWVSWTDENGKFDMPGLPAGRYRIEAQQLGFEAASVETEFKADARNEADVVLRVVSLATATAEKPAEHKPEASAAPSTAENGKTEPGVAPNSPEQKIPPQQNAQSLPGARPTQGQPAPGQRPGQPPARGQQPNAQQAIADAIRQRMAA
ncbi:MAG TPA: carboxypeptidase regulatory-like domain-containing protein, partial [Candidatus Acidoferrales bacterium]|nr:carboxypeptidase regulatory-like domain-containing protein [Candidatus Acidoferrales bacterium]